MKHQLFLENQKKRLHLPLILSVCFAMFSFWQMGFIYFCGPSLTIDGRTPLPISMDNITFLIVAAYIASILFMCFFPHLVVTTERVCALIALLTAFGLFLPFSETILRLLIYTQVFVCCFMIGFETFIIVNFLSEQSNIRHLTVAYGISVLLIAVVQNDFLPFTFSCFMIMMVIALIMLVIFCFHLPNTKEALPQYIRKSYGIPAPKKLLFGTYILIFVGALMGVSGPALSGETTHGVFITYFTDALVSLFLYLLYKKAGIHPFRSISICIGLGAIGFLFMFATDYWSFFTYISCALIGVGMVPCQMLPLYGAVLMKSYPSKYISPIIIGLALIAVLVQSSMVEIFRSNPSLLYLSYSIIMLILAILYLQIEPFFLYTFRKKLPDTTAEKVSATQTDSAPVPLTVPCDAPADNDSLITPEHNDPLSVLTKREREVAELICLGHSNADIAGILFISEHTVKDHTKKIYPKLQVHSRYELAALVNNSKKNEQA